MKVTEQNFGFLPNKKEAKLFTFQSSKKLTVSITNYGGIITSIIAPNASEKEEEITAGFSNLNDYLKGHPHFGVIVGRFANRIEKGRFSLNGKEFVLPINNGPNHLHGGENGFHTKLWDFKLTESTNYAILTLTYQSPDLEEGYPGNLLVTVVYTITDSNEIEIEYRAKTDTPTHVNLTSHCYFNLNGFKSNIYNHLLTLDSSKYLEVDSNQIPTGKLIDCTDSPFDFTDLKLLGSAIQKIDGGIDHCYAIKPNNNFDKPVAKLVDSESGRCLTLFSTQPGIQVYTGNCLDGSIVGHNNTKYKKHWAVCLETQHFPDSPNKENFPSTLLTPNQHYYHKARMVFSTEKLETSA